jgi:hypothetical protein
MRMQAWLPAGLIAAHLLAPVSIQAQDAPRPAAIKPVAGTTIALQPVSALQRGRLDLRPPKITELFSQETIDRALRGTASNVIEEVEVEGRRYSIPPSTPDIPLGIAAPFWALFHPTQAWRILLPLAPDQALQFSGPPPRADDPYRPVMLGPAFQ